MASSELCKETNSGHDNLKWNVGACTLNSEGLFGVYDDEVSIIVCFKITLSNSCVIKLFFI